MFRKLCDKYKHGWVFLYALIYMPWFIYLEKHVTTDYNIIHSALDDKIPFIEYFIIPYMLWFLFMAVTIGYFFLYADKTEFYRLITTLFTGMTLFLIISTIYPNGQQLRPETFARDNLFTDMVKYLYKTDTPTNIFPSIHVYNSLCAYIAIAHNRKLSSHRWIRISAFVLTAAIILSTMFLKQHSTVDVIAAFAVMGVMYLLVYVPKKEKASVCEQTPSI